MSPLPAPAAEDAPHPGQWRIPASDDPTILALQRDMVEAWAIARLNFFDPTYGGLGQDGWDAGVKSALVSAFAAPDPDIAAYQLAELVSSLNDPYTRWQPPADYATFRTGTDGELQVREHCRGDGGERGPDQHATPTLFRSSPRDSR